MIMEDFVTFDLAKKLKEKGFDFTIEQIYVEKIDESGKENSITIYPKPSISQVLKWLREEKGYHVCIALGEFSDWTYDISKIDGNVFCEAMDDFHSYEDAALAGIKYILDNLI